LRVTQLLIVTRSILNQTDSPLLRLPAELRNSIYEYGFNDLTINIRPRSKIVLTRDGHVLHNPESLALTAVSRQLYAETKLLPFLFRRVSGEFVGHFMEGIKKLSLEQRHAIREITFYVDDTDMRDLAASNVGDLLDALPFTSLQDLIRPVLDELPAWSKARGDERELQLIAKYRQLQGRRRNNIDTWLEEWLHVVRMCTAASVPDVTSPRIQRDFLLAVKGLDET
jgi:hypothetical protein